MWFVDRLQVAACWWSRWARNAEALWVHSRAGGDSPLKEGKALKKLNKGVTSLWKVALLKRRRASNCKALIVHSWVFRSDYIAEEGGLASCQPEDQRNGSGLIYTFGGPFLWRPWGFSYWFTARSIFSLRLQTFTSRLKWGRAATLLSTLAPDGPSSAVACPSIGCVKLA